MRWSAVLMLAAMAGPAAAWQAVPGEDPMDDTITAFISQVTVESTRFNFIALGFKCWKDQPDETLFLISTSQTFDSAANYPPAVLVEVRVDKNPIIAVTMAPVNRRGFFGLVVGTAKQPDVATLLARIGTAKKTISLGFATSAYRVPVTGSTKAVSRFTQICGLKLPFVQ